MSGWTERVVIVVLVLCMPVVTASSTHAQCMYQLEWIPSPSAGCLSGTWAKPNIADINDHGEVVGTYDFFCNHPNTPFIWSPETGLEYLPVYQLLNSAVHGINNAGQILGKTAPPLGVPFGIGVIWEDGKISQVLTPILPGGTTYKPEALGPSGHAVGFSIDSFVTTGVVHYDGTMTDLSEVLEKAGLAPAASKPLDVNRHGDATGYYRGPMAETWEHDSVVWWSDGTYSLPGTPPGCFSSDPKRINSFGDVVGEGRYWETGKPGEDGVDVFLWSEGQMSVIEPLFQLNPGNLRDFNDAGQIVVRESIHDVLWQGDERIVINDHVIGGDELASFGNYQAINERGQLLGTGMLEFEGPDMQVIVILTPIDQPAEDITNDCRVDGDDLALLLRSWGMEGGPNGMRADLDGSGVVDARDLGLLLSGWSP